MGEFSNNFIVRAVAYTVYVASRARACCRCSNGALLTIFSVARRSLAAPGFGIAPTYAGAFFLVTTSCIYIKAHMKGESLMTLPKEGRERQPKKESAPKGGDQAAAPKETAKAKSSGKSAVVLPAAPVVRPGVPAGYGAKKRANAEENAVYAAAYAPEPAAYEQPAAAQEEYDQTYDQTYDQEYDQTYDQEYDQTYENQEYYEEGYTDDQQYHAE